jgi:hypothetical protein
MKTKNLIMGASNIENIDYVKNWIVSAKQFKNFCDIILLVYKYDKKLIEENKELFTDIKLIFISNTAYLEPINDVIYDTGLSSRDTSKNLIHHLRFFHYWQFLSECEDKYQNVLITDVKDVVFNNLDFLKTYLDKILVANECILFEDEEWNTNNVLRNFGPYIYDKLKDKSVGCCGVIAGNYNNIEELSLTLYNLASGKYVADQSSLNVLKYTNRYYLDLLKYNKDFCLQVHTRMLLQEKSAEPYVFNINTINQFPIIHQYERHPELLEYVNNKFSNLK